MADKKSIRLNNGVEIPMVGYGSYLATKDKGRDTIKIALDAGYRYIDTARFYNNEEEIGQALKEYGLPRNEVFLCSKVWPTDLGLEKTKEAFEESCRCLGTDYLDMYLIHWPKKSQEGDWITPVRDGWKALEELYAQGRIRAIGLSNFLPHHIRPLLETANVKPALDQLELHAGYMQEYTLAYLQKEEIQPQAWSPMGRGRLLGDDRIIKLAEKYQKSSAQILLGFLLQRGIPVIPKASSMERMKENLNVFDFCMTEDEIAALSCIPETGWSGEHPDLVEF